MTQELVVKSKISSDGPCQQEQFDIIERLRKERDSARLRLEEAEELIAAIRAGKIDVVLPDHHHQIAANNPSETYRILIENIDQGAATLSDNGTILYANRPLSALFGTPLPRLIGSSLFSHIPTVNHPQLTRWLASSGVAKKSGEWRIQSQDGGEIVLHAAVRPLPINYGSSFSLIVSDIGPALEREELRLHNLNLEQEAIELTAAKHAAEQASQAKSVFLATMSHELRTPLNAVIGFTELLLMSEIDPGRRENMSIIREASRSLLQIIQSILDLSRIESGHTCLEEDNFVLSDVVEAVLSMFCVQAEKKGVELSSVVDQTIPTILCGDAKLLEQILANLVGNSIKFTTSGVINITVSSDSPAVLGDIVNIRFNVQDTGIGIRPESIGRIFEMFEQEDASYTRRYGGSGLGLSISRRLVTLLGGDISVESTPGVGSTFSFNAPFKTGVKYDNGLTDLSSNDSILQFKNTNILVVEDDFHSRKLLVNTLKNVGYSVWSAKDGRKALKILGMQTFSLVLMDIQLPYVSGIDITLKVRAGEVAGCDPNIPIIAVTAYAMSGDREKFLQNGMTGYVSKPISPANLSIAVARALAGQTSGA